MCTPELHVVSNKWQCYSQTFYCLFLEVFVSYSESGESKWHLVFLNNTQINSLMSIWKSSITCQVYKKEQKQSKMYRIQQQLLVKMTKYSKKLAGIVTEK